MKEEIFYRMAEMGNTRSDATGILDLFKGSKVGDILMSAFIALYIVIIIVMLFMMLIELLLWLKDVDGREERGTAKKQIKMGIAVIVVIIAPFILISGIQWMITMMFG